MGNNRKFFDGYRFIKLQGNLLRIITETSRLPASRIGYEIGDGSVWVLGRMRNNFISQFHYDCKTFILGLDDNICFDKFLILIYSLMSICSAKQSASIQPINNYQLMANKRKNLSDQLIGIQSPKKVINTIDYQKLIKHQQQVIKLLHQQITQLRQYLFYVADYDHDSFHRQSKAAIPKQTGETHIRSMQTNADKRRRMIEIDNKNKGLKGLVQEVMKAVNAKIPEQIMGKLKEMQEKAHQKVQPVFIQRVKQKQVPVTIEVVRQVAVEKIVQKTVQVPIFRQKVIEKYIMPNHSFETAQNKKNRSKGNGDQAKKLNLTSQRYKEKESSEDANPLKTNKGNYTRWDKWGKKKKKNLQTNN